MKPDRVIKLPVFRTMFRPVARKEWKCDICKKPVEIERRYTHYIDRQPHKIINYRFHNECFGIVVAYCMDKDVTIFTPTKVRNWAHKRFCERCKNECQLHRCKRIENALKRIAREHKKRQKEIEIPT